MILPRFSKHGFENIRKNMLRKLVIFYSACIAAIVTYWFVSPYIFNIFFPAYTEAISYTQWASLILLNVPTRMPLQALIAHLKSKQVYFIKLIQPLTKLVLMVILIPFFGVWGAILSLVVFTILNNVILLTVFFMTARQ